jgi:UTP--glucose-1-phosphate uridylyltransferase
MKVKQAVITAAGFGTRFLPVVKNIPKEMLPIIDKPILQYVVEECMQADLEKVIIVVRKGNNVIKDYFNKDASDVKQLLESVGKGDRYKSVEKLLSYKDRIVIIEQEEGLPYGNGSPVISAKPYLTDGEPFAVLFADDVVKSNSSVSSIKQLIDYFEKNNPIGVLAAQEVEESEVKRYGAIKPKTKFDEQSGIIDYIVEKPEPGTQPTNLITYGRYVVSYQIFNYLKADAMGLDNEVWLQDANSKLASEGDYHYMAIDGKWFTTGDPMRHFEAQIEYFLNSPEFAESAKDYLKNLKF